VPLLRFVWKVSIATASFHTDSGVVGVIEYLEKTEFTDTLMGTGLNNSRV